MKKLHFILLIALLFSIVKGFCSVEDSLNKKLINSNSNLTKIETLNQLGIYYESVSNYPKALEVLYQAIHLNKSKSTKETVISYNYLGYVYWHKSEYDSSLYYHNKALNICEENDISNEFLAFTYLMLGNDYYDKGNFGKSAEHYYKSLKIAEKINDVNILVQNYNRLSKLHYKMNDYPLSLSNVQKSIKINKHKNIRELGVSYNCLGNLALSNNKNDSALYFFTKTLNSFKRCGDIIGQSVASINLGDTYLALYKNSNTNPLLDSSFFYYKKSYLLNQQVDNKFGMIYGLWGMADIGLIKENYDKSLSNYKKALELSQNIGAKSEELNIYYKLHFLFDNLSKTDSSLYYLKKHLVLKNKVESSEQAKQLLKQESYYKAQKIIDKEKAESEKKLLIENEKSKWKNIFLLLIAIAALVLSYITYISIKRLKIIRSKNTIINNINNKLEHHQQSITDSIKYARSIQNAILPSNKLLKELFPNHFLYYQPKDIVAGDFYWVEKIDNNIIFAIADCTGHGVPGAVMSVICSNALSNAVKEHGITSPELILNKVNETVKKTLKSKSTQIRDGMDISLCLLNPDTHHLKFSGAYNSLFYYRDNKLHTLEADRMSVGNHIHKNKTFTLKEVTLQPNDMLYLTTDGYYDQFGGPKNKKFKSKALKNLLLKINQKPVNEQHKALKSTFKNWKGDFEQVDDVCVMGVRI